MAKEHWRARRFLKHQVVKSIDEAEHICVPGIPLFGRDSLSLWLNGLMHQQVNLSLLLNKLPYWFDYGGLELLLKKAFVEKYKDKSRQDKTRTVTHDYKKELLAGIARLSEVAPPEYTQLLSRHYSTPDGDKICYTDMSTRTRLLIGHSGSASVLEVGVTLHPYYGFPIIPGSAVKGVTRHFCKDTEQLNSDKLEEIFGNEPGSEPPLEGAVVFYDAWPIIRKPGRSLLELDNITTHYPDYYREYQQQKPPEGDQPTSTDRATGKEDASVFPADNQNPIPVFFLAVPRDVTFRFAVRPSANTDRPELTRVALQQIEKALVAYGIGAKTGSSYGYFRQPG